MVMLISATSAAVLGVPPDSVGWVQLESVFAPDEGLSGSRLISRMGATGEAARPPSSTASHHDAEEGSRYSSEIALCWPSHMLNLLDEPVQVAFGPRAESAGIAWYSRSLTFSSVKQTHGSLILGG